MNERVEKRLAQVVWNQRRVTSQPDIKPDGKNWLMDTMPFHAVLKEKLTDDYPLQYLAEGKYISFKPVGGLPSVGLLSQDKRSVSYRNALGAGISIELQTSQAHWRKLITIDGLQALGDISAKEFAEFTFEVETDFDIPERENKKPRIKLGENSFIEVSQAWDSAPEVTDEETGETTRNETAVRSFFKRENGKLYFTKQIPVEWLKTATFPVWTDVDIVWGTASEFESGETVLCQCCEIDTNKFVVAYQDSDDGDAGKARVGTVSGATITWGDISEFCGDIGVSGASGVCKLDTDKFVVVYGDDVDGDKLKARVGNVSTRTITWADAGDIETLDADATTHISCCQLETDKFAAVYYDGAGCVCVCTVSGDVITAGTPVAFEGVGMSRTRCCKLDTDKLVAFYCLGSTDVKACAFTVVDTTPTAGTIKAIDTAATYSFPKDCCQLDTDKSLIVWDWDDSSPFCVAASSKISMASGYKRAEDVRVGDWLISYDTEAKQFVNRRVVGVQKNVEPYLLINGALKSGYNHPVWCNGKFIAANEVRVGDLLLDSSGKEQSVFSIENQREPVDAYDFALDSEPHTFFADGYLVHNVTKAGKIEICTVSGTTITEGAEVELNPSSIPSAGLAKVDSTHFVVVYRDGGNADKGTSRYCSFSGTTITLGDEEIFNDAATNYTDVCLISPDKIAVVYQDDGDVNDIGEAIIGDTPAPPAPPGLENKSAGMAAKMIAGKLI